MLRVQTTESLKSFVYEVEAVDESGVVGRCTVPGDGVEAPVPFSLTSKVMVDRSQRGWRYCVSREDVLVITWLSEYRRADGIYDVTDADVRAALRSGSTLPDPKVCAGGAAPAVKRAFPTLAARWPE